ncbi:MAG: polysaccharide biosynthesis protein [Cyclobacteriaceae bacterium]
MKQIDLPLHFDLSNQTLLITGGTGSYGSTFVKLVLANYPTLKQLIVYSRDEYKQLQLMTSLDQESASKVRFVIGDIRDKEALETVFTNHTVDYVVHAAALKHISFSESNPSEFIKTNSKGSHNIIELSKKYKVKQLVAISTDKAATSSNVYGATKLSMEKMLLEAQKGSDTLFTAIRFGNFWASRGSVVPLFFQQFRKDGFVKVFHKEATRYFISLDNAVRYTLQVFSKQIGGEILVPKLSSIKIIDIAKNIAGENVVVEALRQGEKIHETLLSDEEMNRCLETDHEHVIFSNLLPEHKKQITERFGVTEEKVTTNLCSSENSSWITTPYLKDMLTHTN